MIRIDSQIHGYRQGHQLLSASAKLPKEEQSVIDRLSDMAGPLRPGELFDPYLSGYPLPSRRHYVLARTWQDLKVSRAGCVRTLSLLIPISVWSSAPGIQTFLNLLDVDAFPTTAEHIVTESPTRSPLPLAPNFRSSELVEAIFLEEGKPVAIFGVPEPELVLVRLLTALWPSIRGRFSVSTFALSPRKIQGRNFDLVFAPIDARPKFVDWPGRRVDGRSARGARHRWTSIIVDRVFKDPFPRLVNDSNKNLIEFDEADDATALRIALMWDDLLEKLKRSPSAALGLLDISSSGTPSNAAAILALEPLLADAADRAVGSLPASEAWDFIGAMVRKLHRTPTMNGVQPVAAASRALAEQDPVGAIMLLDHPDSDVELEVLVPCIADGISEHVSDSAERALLSARPETLARLICAGKALVERVVNTPSLVERLGEVLNTLPPMLFDDVRRAVLPLLSEDSHFAAALPLLASLDSDGLQAEVRHLADRNNFKATTFIAPMVARAREIGAVERFRDSLLLVSVSENRDLFLRSTLTLSIEDIVWLLEGEGLDLATADRFLVDLLRTADSNQIHMLLSDESIATAVLTRVPLEAAGILRRIVLEFEPPLTVYLSTILRLLPVSESHQRVELALKALERCLPCEFGGDRIATVSMLLGAVGTVLDGEWVIRCGLTRGIAPSISNRNLVGFEQASGAARDRILNCIDELARTLEGRYTVDLDTPAAEACAQLLLDANVVDPDASVRASGRILPMLLRSRRKPVSVLIATTFPFVYRELGNEDRAPNLIELMLFVEWDRRKTARKKLVDAFLSSSVWAPGDLALTACRCLDVERILKRTAKSIGGEAYLERLEADLQRLPTDCKELIQLAISDIRSNWSEKYHWRD